MSSYGTLPPVARTMFLQLILAASATSSSVHSPEQETQWFGKLKRSSWHASSHIGTPDECAGIRWTAIGFYLPITIGLPCNPILFSVLNALHCDCLQSCAAAHLIVQLPAMPQVHFIRSPKVLSLIGVTRLLYDMRLLQLIVSFEFHSCQFKSD